MNDACLSIHLESIVIPYVNDEEANAATKDPHLKLLFRLVKFCVRDPGKRLTSSECRVL